MPNFKPWLWREVRLFELRILDTIIRHYSIQKWPSSKESVGSRKDVTSSNQDIKTNVATLVSRRGVRGSCFILCVFCLSLPWKRLCRLVVVLAWLDDVTRRPLIQMIPGLQLGNLSNGGRVFDTFTWPGLFLHKNSISWSKCTNLSFFDHKHSSSVKKKTGKKARISS